MPPRIPLAQRIATHVRRLRLGRKWSQEALAEQASLAKTSIQAIERGDNSEIYTLERIAVALHIDGAELFAPTQPLARGGPGRPSNAKVAEWRQPRTSDVMELGSPRTQKKKPRGGEK